MLGKRSKPDPAFLETHQHTPMAFLQCTFALVYLTSNGPGRQGSKSYLERTDDFPQRPYPAHVNEFHTKPLLFLVFFGNQPAVVDEVTSNNTSLPKA